MKSVKYISLFLMLLVSFLSNSQSDKYINILEVKDEFSAVNFLLVKGDSASLDTLSHYVAKLGHLSGVALEGKIENKESLWASLYELRLLEQIIFLNNDLTQIQLGASSSTVKELWITGSSKLRSENLNSVLSQTKYLQVLRINNIDDKQVLEAISSLKLLSTAQFTNCNWSFRDIAIQLRYCTRLSYLDLSDNKFQLTGKGVKYLGNLNYLDLSGNHLANSPLKMKYLKNLDTLILNRNKINNKEPIVHKLQKLSINYLVFDTDSIRRKDKITYLLPGVDIVWTGDKITKNSFTLPFNTSVIRSENIIDSISFEKKLNSYASPKDTSIRLLSPAFIVYDQLCFPNPLVGFDTSSYATRYLNPDYIYTHKINNQNHTPSNYYYPLKYDKSHKNWYKKNSLKKLDHKLHSYVQIEIVEPPKKYKGNVLIKYHVSTLKSKRTELDAYKGVVWEALDYSDKKMFEADYVKQRAWSDIRIVYDESKKTYSFVFKGRFENKTLSVQPRNSRDVMNLQGFEKASSRMTARYKKTLAKSERNFNRNLQRSKLKKLKPDSREIADLWKKVTLEMSAEEKGWTKEKWLAYYKKIKSGEFYLLAKHQLSIPYFGRFIESQAFKKSTGFDFYVGQKWIDFELMENDSTSLLLKDYSLIDIDRKVVKYFKATDKNKILFEPFHQYLFIGQLEDGRVVTLNYKQLLAITKTGKLEITQSDFIDSNITNASFYRNIILPILNSLNY